MHEQSKSIIRVMKREEVQLAVDLAAEQGWNPGINDSDSFYAADPNGFFISETDGKLNGTISAIRYGDSFGFIGFFIVLPEYRASHIGVNLSIHALNYLRGRNMGLDGVVERIENYKRLGFMYAYRNVRYVGIGGGVKQQGLAAIEDIPFDIINDYDRHCFPERRDDFLRCWLNMPDAFRCAILENGRLEGYGMLRKCGRGWKIGPLFADNGDTAEKILLGLISNIPGEQYYFDIPDPNESAKFFIEKYHLKLVFETARMYSKEIPVLRLDKVFGVTTFELG